MEQAIEFLLSEDILINLYMVVEGVLCGQIPNLSLLNCDCAISTGDPNLRGGNDILVLANMQEQINDFHVEVDALLEDSSFIVNQCSSFYISLYQFLTRDAIPPPLLQPSNNKFEQSSKHYYLHLFQLLLNRWRL